MPELFVVVCSELHSAIGPFDDPRVALVVAQKMTRESPEGCTYVPMPFRVVGKVIDAHEVGDVGESLDSDGADGRTSWRDRGYL